MIAKQQTQLHADHFDAVAIEYDFIAELFHNPEFFLSHMPEQKHLALDLGCGSGFVTDALAQHFEHVIGVDLSYELLQIADAKRNSPNINYILADIQQLGLQGQFDYIISGNVFHHLDDVPRIIETIKKMLQPNGRFVMTDVVSPNRTPPRYVYIVGAVQEYLPNLCKYGLQDANRVFRFRLSKHWLDHLATDCYLSNEEFKTLFQELLPDCIFPAYGKLVWQKSALP